MATRTRVLMLLGIVFLASSVSLSYGIAYWELEKPCHKKCVLSCNKENDAYRQNACQARCNLIQKNFDDRECEEEEEVEKEREEHSRHWEPKRQRGRQEGEKEEEEWETREEREEHSRQPWQPRRHPQEREGEQEEEEHHVRRIRREERQRGSRRESEDEDEDEDEDDEERERERRREKKEQRQERGEEGSGSSESRRSNNNPFLFRSNSRRFQTLFKNEYGSIRLLQRFDERSKHRFQHLGKVRVVEVRFKPNTLLLPHHTDADFILAILSGN